MKGSIRNNSLIVHLRDQPEVWQYAFLNVPVGWIGWAAWIKSKPCHNQFGVRRFYTCMTLFYEVVKFCKQTRPENWGAATHNNAYGSFRRRNQEADVIDVEAIGRKGFSTECKNKSQTYDAQFDQ